MMSIIFCKFFCPISMRVSWPLSPHLSSHVRVLGAALHCIQDVVLVVIHPVIYKHTSHACTHTEGEIDTCRSWTKLPDLPHFKILFLVLGQDGSRLALLIAILVLLNYKQQSIYAKTFCLVVCFLLLRFHMRHADVCRKDKKD